MKFEIAPKSTETKADWYVACEYCNLLTVDGKSGWRLLTKEELDQIYHSENDFNDDDWYWTSTVREFNTLYCCKQRVKNGASIEYNKSWEFSMLELFVTYRSENMKRIDVYKETNDDWHPSYTVQGWTNLKLVTVSFTQTGPNPDAGDGEWRVCVWGGDDCGMERDYTDQSLAMAMFNRVIQWEFVDIDNLKKHGFVSA